MQQEKQQLAIDVTGIKKVYKLYDKPSDRMREAFGLLKNRPPKKHYALNGVDLQIRTG